MKYNIYMKNIFVLTAFIACFVSFTFVFSAIFFPLKYTDEVFLYSEKYELKNELIFAVIKAESGFDSKKTSEKGATGLMQIMPTTAEYVSREFFGGRKIDLTSPKDNIETGCFYLNYLREKFGNETETLAAYNAGEGNVKLWKRERGGKLSADDIPFPETKKYVRRVKAYAKIYSFILNFVNVTSSRFITQ